MTNIKYPEQCITAQDYNTIERWIKQSSNIDKIYSIPQMISVWGRNKNKMFRALGKNLRVSISIPQKYKELYQIKTLYYEPIKGIHIETSKGKVTHVDFSMKTLSKNWGFFWSNFLDWVSGKGCYLFEEKGVPITDKQQLIDFLTMFNYENILNNAASSKKMLFFTKDDCESPLKIPGKTKSAKAIKKVLEYYGFPHISALNTFFDGISVLKTNIKNNVMTFSIHPADFLTLSDNASDWTSCLRFSDRNHSSRGEFCGGCLEMMNSNNIIIAYIENEKTKFFDGEIPNKGWRALICVEKDVIVVDKSYPYNNDGLTFFALDSVRKMVKKNLGWRYQSLNKVFKNGYWWKEDKIKIKTNMMYNDIENQEDDFWCCKNHLKENRSISISGPAYCIRCGAELGKGYSDSTDYICDDCKEGSYCEDCGCEDFTGTFYNVRTSYGYGSFNQKDFVISKNYNETSLCEDCLSRYCIICIDDEYSLIPSNNLEYGIDYYGDSVRRYVVSWNVTAEKVTALIEQNWTREEGDEEWV